MCKNAYHPSHLETKVNIIVITPVAVLNTNIKIQL